MMNQEDIFKKIGQILNELNDQYQYLAQNPRELNELELELFLANASFLADHVNIIKKINSGTAPRILSGAAESRKDGPVEDHSATHEILPARPRLDDDIFKLDNEPSNFEFILSERPSSDQFEFEEKSVDEIFDRPLSKEEEVIIAQKQKLREMDSLGIQLPEDDEVGPEPFLVSEPVIETEVEEVPAIPEPEEKEIIPVTEPIEEEIIPFIAPVREEPVPVTEQIEEVAEEPVHQAEPVKEPIFVFEAKPVQEELFTPVPVQKQEDIEPEKPVAKPTLNDILAGNTAARNINSENSRAEIKDLKQAISLNDKMRYIRDLFNGYNLAYAEAIDLVNKMPDFKSADEFLQRSYAAKNNWAAKQETVDQFYELLNQRFTVK